MKINKGTRLALASTMMAIWMAPAAAAQGAKSSTLPTPRAVTSDLEKKVHLGLRVGAVSPGSGYDKAPEFGVEYGHQPYIPFGMSVEFSGYETDREVSDLNRLKLLAKGSYNFGGQIPVIRDAFVGAGLGPVLDTVNDVARARLGISLQTGFDIPLTDSGNVQPRSYSLGADARYLFVSDSSPDDFNLTGVVKYWF